MPSAQPVVVGVSGASGAALAERVVERLLAAGQPVELVATASAKIVWRQELGAPLAETLARWKASGLVTEHNPNNQAATIASGSYPVRGMVIVPCSMGTVASIAAGLASNLLLRVADVTQKEGRRLVVVPRETPLSPIHLENLLRLAQRGVRIVPPMPNFYQRPTTVAEVVDFVAARALVALGVASELDAGQQWQGLEIE
ncbi:MAG TPA: UbiX family flavin prenyltransferase [Herpetosiphonaceae bacterium]